MNRINKHKRERKCNSVRSLFFILHFSFFIFLLASCDTIIDLEDMPEPEPTTGKVTLVTDWTKRTEDIAIPSSYTAIVDNQLFTLYNTSYTLPEIPAGTYSATIYNTTDKITLNGTTATVKTDGNTLDPDPGWLFTYTGEIIFEAGKEKTVTAIMVQQVRQLSFELDITGGNADALQSVMASLTGVANGMDFKANTYTGTGLSAIPVLTREGNKLRGSVRLIGLTNEAKMLTLDITYTTGKAQQIISDVGDRLSNFNQDKHKAIKLTTNMEITNQAGFEATIKPWEPKESGGIAW